MVQLDTPLPEAYTLDGQKSDIPFWGQNTPVIPNYSCQYAINLDNGTLYYSCTSSDSKRPTSLWFPANDQTILIPSFVAVTDPNIFKMKDVKVVSATGHSLGGALAQKIAAKYHIPAVTFSTAGVGKQLTGEEKQWLRGPGKNLVLNYMHLGDQIPSSTNAKEFGTALYAIDFSDGSLFSGHQLGSYQFDNSGNLFVKPSVASEYSNIITTQGLDNLKKIMKKFEKSGGALTTGQKQFLDEYEALTLVTGMQVLVASELKSLEMMYEKSIDEAQKLWSNADAAARLIGIDLAEYERLSILDSGGVSRTTIETKPTTKYHKKIAKVKAVIKDYTDLTSKITAAIRHQAETDQALAAQIKGWL